MDTQDLTSQIETMLARREAGSDYRVERVLKDGPRESTQVVYLLGAGGGEYGPFVRKVIAAGCGMGNVYQTLQTSWHSGRRFLHLPEVLNVSERGEDIEVLMEYVDGPTLEAYLAAIDFDRGAALQAFEDVCLACIELHDSFTPPVIHRDLKPSNIIMANNRFTSMPTAVLIDFGIARQWREGESSDTVHFGTRDFAPPEQYGFAQTTIRSDVFALGVLLAYCLVGYAVPCDRLAPALADADVSPELIRVAERACAFDPSNRFGSVQELLDDFRAARDLGDAPSDRMRDASAGAESFKSTLFFPPSATTVARTVQSPGARFIDRPFIRLPWNFFILFAAAASVQGTNDLFIHPTDSMRDVSLPAQLIMAYLMVLPFFLFCCWVLYNKSWLRRKFALIDRVASIGLSRLAIRLLAFEAAAMVAALILWFV